MSRLAKKRCVWREKREKCDSIADIWSFIASNAEDFKDLDAVRAKLNGRWLDLGSVSQFTQIKSRITVLTLVDLQASFRPRQQDKYRVQSVV